MHPKSFTPATAVDASDDEDDGVDVVPDLDRSQPARMPAMVFRSATTVMVVMWALGLVTPFGIVQGFTAKPLELTAVHEEKNTKLGLRSDGQPELMPGQPLPSELPQLPGREAIRVDWPAHSGFVPRSLSCDPAGTLLVVSDDFMVFSGRLHDERGKGEETATEASATYRSGEKLAVSFEPIPPCRDVEGNELKDIGVACPDMDPNGCRVLALLAYKQQLAECPISSSAAAPIEAEEHISGFNLPAEAPPKSSGGKLTKWTVSDHWLRPTGVVEGRSEFIQSLAINSQCARNQQHFRPATRGCVVVGTTTGRLVQLRGASDNQQLLIPARTIQALPHGFAAGTLHVLSNGALVALRRETGSVQVTDSRLGALLGEWRLPLDVLWLTLCGGGDSLYLLGIGKETHTVEMYRFPIPRQVKEASTRPAPARQKELRVSPYEM